MKKFTTQEKVHAYEGVSDSFAHLAKEVRALGMKKPSETLSTRKVNFINRFLTDTKEFTRDEPEARYLDLLDDDALPQYSDAILILSQYEGALTGFRTRYLVWDDDEIDQVWQIKR
jgi:hypothetical protein